jgi:hypothetical protein
MDDNRKVVRTNLDTTVRSTVEEHSVSSSIANERQLLHQSKKYAVLGLVIWMIGILLALLLMFTHHVNEIVSSLFLVFIFPCLNIAAIFISVRALELRVATNRLNTILAGTTIFLALVVCVGLYIYLFMIPHWSGPLPDRCIFTTKFTCRPDQFVISARDKSTVQLMLQNRMGEDIRTFGWHSNGDFPYMNCDRICFDQDNVAGCDASMGDTMINIPEENAVLWKKGESKTVSVDCSEGHSLISGDRSKVTLNMSYYPTDENPRYVNSAQGEIFTRVSRP